MKKEYQDLLYVPKHAKVPDKVFRFRMVISIVSIIACLIVMMSSAFALFSSEVSSIPSTITSANYSITVTDSGGVKNSENGVYICQLKERAAQDMYTFTITAGGTASTGYCQIKIGDKVYYTEQIEKGASITLTVQAAQGTQITFTPQWGTSSYYNINGATYGDKDTIRHTTTPFAEYTVEPTAKLSDIAAHYRVSEEDILFYNGISPVAVVDEQGESAFRLEPNTVLYIPGVAEEEEDVTPYSVPYATYKVEPTATLSDIAAHYGVSEEDIILYNSISKNALADEQTEDTFQLEMNTAFDIPEFEVGEIIPEADTLFYSGISENEVFDEQTEDTFRLEPNMALYIPGVAEEDVIPYSVPYVTYVVEPTATLADIAAHYGVSEADILIYNDIAEIYVGMELKIPGITEYTDGYFVPYVIYMVEPTATLTDIAAHYGVPETDILFYNNITEIYVNMLLKIPGVTAEYPRYVAPVIADTYENNENEAPGEMTDPIITDDNVLSEEAGTNGPTDGFFDQGAFDEGPTSDIIIQEPFYDEPALLYANDFDYYITSESTIMLSAADILIYRGSEYQQGYDYRITGIEADGGENFCTINMNTETLSVCLESTANIEEGYLKVIIEGTEYYTAQIKQGSYIRLDIYAPAGTEVRFEAYSGYSQASIHGAALYGDDLNDATDGNNPTIDYYWYLSQIPEIIIPEDEWIEEEPTDETPTDETPTDETPTDETPTDETPTDETPTDDTSTDDTSTDDTSTDDTSTDDTSTDDTSTDDTSTDDTSTDETSTDETSTDDTSTDDTSTDDTSTDDTPTSDTPTSDAPTSDAPTSDIPTSDIPTSDIPTSDPPTSDTPTSDTPTDDGSGLNDQHTEEAPISDEDTSSNEDSSQITE